VPPSFRPPETGDDWLDVGEGGLPIGLVHDWCVVPRAGAVVLFSGTVRDHAPDDDGVVRTGVQHLTYEAYDAQVVPSFSAIVDELRRRWPDTARVALLHRTGRLELGESSVVAAVSAPHRPQAFEAARYAIDALKASAPIWKREQWQDADGSVTAAWGAGAHPVVSPAEVPSVGSA
jgi:molybdopterin synthase catalytic subunit